MNVDVCETNARREIEDERRREKFIRHDTQRDLLHV